MSAHARLGPSSAFRWLRCAGSINLIASIGDDRKSQAAAEGTAAHQVRSDCLELGLDPDDFVGQKITVDEWTFEVTEEMADNLQPGIDRLRDVGRNLHVEYRVNLERWLPGQFGTLDAGWYTDTVIGIDDLKYGRIAVSPADNDQLRVYALGFWDQVARHHTDATEFVISIDQPRSHGGGGEWRTTLADLLEFGKTVEAAGKATNFADAKRTPSAKACAYCPGTEFGRCPEFVEYNLALWQSKFDDVDEAIVLGDEPKLPALNTIDADRRAFLVGNMRQVKAWFDHLAEWELADAVAGNPTPGRKAIAGKLGNRKWRDEQAAAKAVQALLGDDSFNKKLKSPAQVDKRISKADYAEHLAPHITRAEGRPVMVDLADARPALLTAHDKFDEEEDGNG